MKENSENKHNPPETFLKGVFMGFSDIVPGVSGGTIALIVGIYERFIFAIKSINFKFIPHLFQAISDRKYLEKARKSFFSIDFHFLLPIGAGMGSAFLVASFGISFVLDNYPAYIYSFFFGLILISAKLVYERIENPNPKGFIFAIIGFTFASAFVGLEEITANHTLPLILASGFLAVSAMMLPGVSGSFMVLFLGQYGYMIDALHSIQTYWAEIGIFLLGGLIGLLSFSRVISYSLRKYHNYTLLFLTGLMIGALRLPLEEVVNVLPESPESSPTLFGAILSGVVGVSLIYLITRKYPLSKHEAPNF